VGEIIQRWRRGWPDRRELQTRAPSAFLADIWEK
jgi:hypothetical protein